MPKSVLAYFLVPTVLFLAHFKAADFSLRCLKWVWTSKSPSAVMLLARWSFVAIAALLLLIPLGLPALPAIAFGFVVAMVHVGAMVYITEDWVREEDA